MKILMEEEPDVGARRRLDSHLQLMGVPCLDFNPYLRTEVQSRAEPNVPIRGRLHFRQSK